MYDNLILIKFFFVIFSTLILLIPLVIRINKVSKIDLIDPIYIFLTGFYFYLVLGQLEIVNLYYLKELKIISNETRIIAMKYVMIAATIFVYLDYIFYKKNISIHRLDNFSFNLNTKSSMTFVFILIIISSTFFTLNLDRFGGVHEYLNLAITKGKRDEIMRGLGNYPFDLLFYMSFSSLVFIINFFKKNIYISIVISILVFSPYFIFKIILFDRSSILKFILFILFIIFLEKKTKINLQFNKKNFFLFFTFLFFVIFFLQLGEIRSSLNKIIRNENFTISNLIKNYQVRSSKLYLREFTNTNYGFLYLIENNLSLSNNSNSYLHIIYSAVPRSILKKFKNIKEEDPIDSLISNNLSNYYFSDNLTRDNKISITNHPLTEAYYNFRQVSPFIAGILFFLIYRIVFYLINHKDYFISRSSITTYPYLFLLWRSQLSGFVSYLFYVFIFYFLLMFIIGKLKFINDK